MVIKQVFNPRIKAWVKFDFTKTTGFKALDVKQKKPRVPFKGVPIKGKKIKSKKSGLGDFPKLF